jgi:hypothetical protein
LLEYQRDRRRERLDITRPDRRRLSRDYVRQDYFSRIDTPRKAYVAGLIAADGNVLDRHRRLTLELSSRDVELAQLACDEIAPGYAIRSRRRSGRDYVIFSITSGQIVTDLGRLGIGPRKSLTLRWPDSISRDFERPFLLGYFDGDGFVTESRTRAYVYGRWALLGTREFLTEAMRFVADAVGIRPRRVRRAAGRIHLLQISGADALLVDQWLHQDGLGLARKRLGVSRSTERSIRAEPYVSRHVVRSATSPPWP